MSFRKSYRCWAEVDLGALRENLAWLRGRVGPRVKIMTVVKADAYGHGLKPIAGQLMQSGTDIFGVANLAEAHSIRSVGKGWPILMLGASLPEEVETAVRDEVMPTLSTLAEAHWYSQAAVKHQKVVSVHIKVDTGMGRLGVEPEQALDLVQHCQQLHGLKVQGLYTHYSTVEDDKEFSRAQAEAFKKLVKRLRAAGVKIPYIHANNSGALLHQSDTLFNLVRPGLLVYGVAPPGQRLVPAIRQPQVRPALSWKCRVSLIKEIKPGKPLSYGHTFIARQTMRVATLTAGYGDGYSRAGSNRAQVLVRGRRCRVLGRITMDQMMVDVSAVPEITVGDEVVLLGRQPVEGATALEPAADQRRSHETPLQGWSEEINVHELAAWMGTIPWEIFTNITYRVPRIYIGGQAA